MQVTLHDINQHNWRQAARLKVSEAQQKFVAPNWDSLLWAQFEGLTARGICSGEIMVGLVLYGRIEGDPRLWIMRFMIELEQQGKGYGRAALCAVIDEIRARYDPDEIYISFVPGNDIARTLYESLGFVDTGQFEDDERVFCLTLKR